jgi:hypothetical protein
VIITGFAKPGFGDLILRLPSSTNLPSIKIPTIIDCISFLGFSSTVQKQNLFSLEANFKLTESTSQSIELLKSFCAQYKAFEMASFG